MRPSAVVGRRGKPRGDCAVVEECEIPNHAPNTASSEVDAEGHEYGGAVCPGMTKLAL